jgi:hypothetical protein
MSQENGTPIISNASDDGNMQIDNTDMQRNYGYTPTGNVPQHISNGSVLDTNPDSNIDRTLSGMIKIDVVYILVQLAHKNTLYSIC